VSDHSVPAQALPLSVTWHRTGQTPLTWAQRVQWNDTEWMKPHDHHFNHGRVIAISPGHDLPGVADIIAHLVQKHECLRTRYPVDATGTPYQELRPTEEFSVSVYETPEPDAEAASALCERLRAQRFDLPAELPLRVSIVASDKKPAYLLLVLSHVTIDYAGLSLLTDELEALLAGDDTPAAPRHQPFDQAASEATKLEQQRSAAALGYWEQVLRAAPATTFDSPSEPLPPEDDPRRFAQLTMTSPALTSATRTVASRLEVSSTTVLMAALNVVLCRVTSREAVPLKLIASNRGLAGLRDLVGITLGSTVILVPTHDRTFAEVVRDTAGASMRAYRRARCNPVALAELRADVSAERGEADIELACGFNDIRTAAPTEDEPAFDLLSRTELRWEEPFPRQETKLWYWVSNFEGVDAHHALVDTHVLSRERTEHLLREVENLVVSAATP
jgi:hypothetical protein